MNKVKGIKGEYPKFGKYLLLERIAVGGMAEVLLAKYQGENGRDKFVALKRILPKHRKDPEFINMFMTEAMVALNLSHEQIVTVHEFSIIDDMPYFTMEYIQGKNLYQILTSLERASARLEMDELVYIVREVAKGLEHAHKSINNKTNRPQNIIHHDISPQNIMVTYDGQVKIIDFGISELVKKSERLNIGPQMGKPRYMSPEQAKDDRVDQRTDVFSLGVVLWEALVGESLFVRDTSVSTLEKIKSCDIRPPSKLNSKVPAELERIVMKALEADPNQRYVNARELYQDLSIFLKTHCADFSIKNLRRKLQSLFSREVTALKDRMAEYNDLPFELNMETAIGIIPEEPEPTKGDLVITGEISVRRQRRKKRKSRMLSMLGFTVAASVVAFGFVGLIPIIEFSLAQKPAIDLAKGGELLLPLSNNGQALVQQQAVARPVPVTAKRVVKKPAAPAANLKRVLIKSQPSGAKIIVEGHDTGLITPAYVNVHKTKPFRLSLMREGYHNLHRRKLFVSKRTGYQFNAKLTKRKVGYLNIDLKPPVASKIYINGKRLKYSSLPIKDHVVPANKKIYVKVVNAKNKVVSKKTLRFAPGQKKSVLFRTIRRRKVGMYK